ncbi:hypothetical protein EU527_10080 [Candidatus Thorarchaeota archaeon]|nr:MAG: hypothetical protein EU527_10080 [Candidatus Thorarchaeota archaeon]
MKRVKVVTIAFAFMIVLLAASTQQVAAASRSDSLRSYINSRYDVQRGGYSPPSDSVVRIDTTYGAILALNELGSLDSRPPPVNITKVLDALIARQWKSNQSTDLDRARFGGFSEYLLGPVTIKMTFMGIILLNMLKAQSDYPGINVKDIDTEAIMVFVNKTQTSDGGFSSVPQSNADIISTFQALFIIDYLDEYDQDLNPWNWLWNETATLEWINSCKEGDAYKLHPNSDLPSVTATASAIMALDLLPSISTVPGLQTATEWVLARQVESSDDPDFLGGFEEGVGTNDPNFISTYYALKVLDHTGGIVSVNSSAAINFILNCQVEGGAWGFIPGASSGNLVYAGQACELLNMLGNAASILSSSVDPYAPGGIVLDWRIFVIIGVLVVALVVAVIAVRMD